MRGRAVPPDAGPAAGRPPAALPGRLRPHARTPGPAVAARLRAAGLHRASLPAANEMGRVNAWILEDEPLTLVDAGIRDEGAIEALEEAFRTVSTVLGGLGVLRADGLVAYADPADDGALRFVAT